MPETTRHAWPTRSALPFRLGHIPQHPARNQTALHRARRGRAGAWHSVTHNHKSWKELFDDKEHSCLLVPILVLAHEHDPDPEMRPSINIDVERREKLILGIAASVTAIYRTLRRSVKEWKQGSTQKEPHIVKQSEKSDATVFDPSIQARN